MDVDEQGEAIGPKQDGPCVWEPCDWWHKNGNEHEYNEVCLRRYLVEETDTIDMFEKERQ
jgi:hypothetical protein